MAVLKCKICGGDIDATVEQTYGTCDHCGTITTLPKAADDQIANLFNRANHFRRQNNFDKAVTAFENILNIDNSSAEAHWGLVLAKYGIEYVEDPVVHQRVPTCHRVQNDSIITDVDYLAALENAEDDYTRSLYEDETKRIGKIQKGILSISSKEKPYDVFICYKETTDGGLRTKDSALAQDVYYQLTNEGYKVFFARITLEDKLGKQYEPYIFAALNSAKVMVVIGTKSEYFNAVWVKNEWSRYLALLRKDRSKLLIPCYSEMDAYDLPEELSMFQSQDMSKIGFIQDLIRGIKKILAVEKSKANNIIQSTDSMVLTPGVSQLLDRTQLFLEDGDFQSASDYVNRILDLEPRNARVYFKKLLVSLEMRYEEDILSHDKQLDDYGDYQKAVRFADESYRRLLEGYNCSIIERLENERIEKTYSDAKDKFECLHVKDEVCAVEPDEFDKLADSFFEIACTFESIRQYRDSEVLIETCKADSNAARELAKNIRLEQVEKEREREAKRMEIRQNNDYIYYQIKILREQQENLLQKKRKLTIFQGSQKTQIDKEYMAISERISEFQAKCR